MSTLEKLEEQATGMCRPDEFERKNIAFALEAIKTGDTRLSTYSVQQEHELRLRLFSRFWCNKAEYFDARKNAERVIADLLYRDVLVELSGIMHAISDGDRRAALNRCGALMDSLRR